ncbi:MAG: hypothetical protein KJ052_03435 [Candidatus Hydrogenedentes bacterium]|nr:hypothetical protein [Candidatus Hydrogenedentota bacterium]
MRLKSLFREAARPWGFACILLLAGCADVAKREAAVQSPEIRIEGFIQERDYENASKLLSETLIQESGRELSEAVRARLYLLLGELDLEYGIDDSELPADIPPSAAPHYAAAFDRSAALDASLAAEVNEILESNVAYEILRMNDAACVRELVRIASPLVRRNQLDSVDDIWQSRLQLWRADIEALREKIEVLSKWDEPAAKEHASELARLELDAARLRRLWSAALAGQASALSAAVARVAEGPVTLAHAPSMGLIQPLAAGETPLEDSLAPLIVEMTPLLSEAQPPDPTFSVPLIAGNAEAKARERAISHWTPLVAIAAREPAVFLESVLAEAPGNGELALCLLLHTQGNATADFSLLSPAIRFDMSSSAAIWDALAWTFASTVVNHAVDSPETPLLPYASETWPGVDIETLARELIARNPLLLNDEQMAFSAAWLGNQSGYAAVGANPLSELTLARYIDQYPHGEFAKLAESRPSRGTPPQETTLEQPPRQLAQETPPAQDPAVRKPGTTAALREEVSRLVYQADVALRSGAPLEAYEFTTRALDLARDEPSLADLLSDGMTLAAAIENPGARFKISGKAIMGDAIVISVVDNLYDVKKSFLRAGDVLLGYTVTTIDPQGKSAELVLGESIYIISR